METTVNAPSRRKSINVYKNIMNNRNERLAMETSAQEEQQKNSLEEMRAASQRNINTLCDDIQEAYTSMVKDGKDMEQCQNELNEKLKEEELFQATADDVYAYKEIDESVSDKMSLRIFSYYALPALDCFFAYFALYQIVTSKLAELALADFAVVIGAALSIVVGLGVSLISRLGVTSLENPNTSNMMRRLQKLAVCGAVMCLPLMYIIGEVAFNGGTQWTYSGVFAFISLIIQLLITTGYKSQMEAFSYFRDKKKMDSAKQSKMNDENAIRREILALRTKMQEISDMFNKDYLNFTNEFRHLAALRDEHLRKFEDEAKFYLNQLVIFFGDLVCFRRDAPIPLYYESNGKVSAIPLVDFPYVYGIREIYSNNDYVYLDYMLQRTQTGISLSETLRLIVERRQQRLNVSTANQSEQHTFNTSANEVVHHEEEAEVGDGDNQGEEGIW